MTAWTPRWPVRRFVVADRSMEPALLPGQGLVGTPWARPRRGQVRCFVHPERPGFWLVKRVRDVQPGGTMTVLSDNTSVTTHDSRTFGPVSVDGSYAVVAVVPLHLMRPRTGPDPARGTVERGGS